MAKVCIIDREEKAGIPIKEDIVINAIRAIKRKLRISTGNDLVVCAAHVEEAKKRRERFERSLMTSAGIGAVLGIILVLLAIFNPNRSIVSVLQAIIFLLLLVLIMAALSLYQYFPAIKERAGAPSRPRHVAKRRR